MASNVNMQRLAFVSFSEGIMLKQADDFHSTYPSIMMADSSPLQAFLNLKKKKKIVSERGRRVNHTVYTTHNTSAIERLTADAQLATTGFSI